MRKLRVAPVLALAAACVAPRASAQTGQNVLVVVNATSADSVQVGQYYARARTVPADQVLRLDLAVADEIPRYDYEQQIEAPLARWMNAHAGHDRILFMVLAKDVPLRIAGTSGRSGTMASVDTELALLYRKMTGRVVAPGGEQPNPYYLGEAAVGTAKPFTHVAHDVFLVTRLDGFTVADATRLVDHAVAPVTAGRVVLDMKAAYQDQANEWLRAAAERLGAAGFGDRVVLEQSAAVAETSDPVLGYYSWGSNDPALRRRTIGLRFAPGAIAGTFVGGSARTFTQPPADWAPGRTATREGLFKGSGDGLAGDLVKEGVTGLAAYVADPFLDRTVRPDILLPAYFAGRNLAEAYYLAIPSLSWQTVVIGDPLCRPFDAPAATAESLDPGIDPATEMPREYARRWLAVAQEDVPENGGPYRTEGLKQALRAQARLANDDKAGAIAALTEATRIDARLNGAQFLLASMYEQAGEHDQAAERYRAILANKNTDVVALNNLAFHLATREHKPGDALPLAERAYVLSRGEPNITDTLAWVYHLTGNGRDAVRYIGEALARGPKLPEIRVHAAAIYEAAGEAAAARRELQAALSLDPRLATRDDVKALREKLGPAPPQ